MPNWIKDFRFNTASLELENKKIFNFIKNHENYNFISDDFYKSKIRDTKISYITSKNWKDPLNYLNQFIDVMFGKFEDILNMPVSIITVIDKDTGHSVRKNCRSETHVLRNVNDFKDWFSKNSNNLIYPYMIRPERNVYKFRVVTINKEQYEYSLK